MFLGFLRLLNSAASAHFMQIRSETLSVALHLFEWMCSSSLLEMQLLPVVFFQALSTLSSIVVQLGLSHNQNSWPSVHSLTLECCSSSCAVASRKLPMLPDRIRLQDFESDFPYSNPDPIH